MAEDQSWAPMILIVEDDPMIGELIMLRLTAAGYRTSWARTGPEALTKIYEVRPKMMVLDLGLPVIDGFGVLEQVRAQQFFKNLPIIVLTGRHELADVKRAMALGASGYMAKPFESKDLVKRVEKYLTMPAGRAAPAAAVVPEPAKTKPNAKTAIVDDTDFLLL